MGQSVVVGGGKDERWGAGWGRRLEYPLLKQVHWEQFASSVTPNAIIQAQHVSFSNLRGSQNSFIHMILESKAISESLRVLISKLLYC